MRNVRVGALCAMLALAAMIAACGPETSGNDAATRTFACGTNTCNNATQYCEHLTSLAGGMTTETYACQALPAGCAGTDYCTTCLSGMTGATGCGVSNTGEGASYTVSLTR